MKPIRTMTMITAVALALPILSQESDARRMGAEEMNPGSTLTSRERIGDGTFRVLVYGNSIALHSPAPSLGWTNDWGMAASSRDKDFAHLVIRGLEEQRGEKANYRIRNLALLERNYTTNLLDFADLAADVAWAPDYVVIAIGENASGIDSTKTEAYTKFLVSLARPLVESAKRPVVLMRSPFWRNETKAACTKRAAEEVGAVYIDAGPLNSDPANKAIGLFEHKGVASHPGDLGMRRLADLFLDAFRAASERSTPKEKEP